MITFTITIPEKMDLLLKIQIDSVGGTLTDIAESLEERLCTGADHAFYFRTLFSKPEDYLDNSKTIDELDLKSSGYKLLAYIKNKEDKLLMLNKFLNVTFIFPEKNDLTLKMQLNLAKTLADIAKDFEKRFEAGAEQACYFRTLSSKPGDYLDNSKTIDELDLKNSESQLLVYIKNKKDIFLMRNKFITATFLFPEKNDQIIKMQLDPVETLADIADGFEKIFGTGVDQACYFRTLSSEPGDYLDNSKSIDKLDLKSSRSQLLVYIKNKKDILLMPNKFLTVTFIFPEIGDHTLEMQLNPAESTLADIAEGFEKQFEAGADEACYFRTLSSKPEDYLDNNKTINELDLKSSGYKLLAYIKNKKDMLLMSNEFLNVTFIFPQKNDLMLKIQLDPVDTTLAEIVETLEEKFGTGTDEAYYFRTLSSKPGDYLDNSKTIDELDLKSSEHQILVYINNKEVQDSPKITITLCSNRDKMSIAVPVDCIIKDIAEVFRGAQNLNANVKLEIYQENEPNPLNDFISVGDAGLRDEDFLIVKKRFTGA